MHRQTHNTSQVGVLGEQSTKGTYLLTNYLALPMQDSFEIDDLSWLVGKADCNAGAGHQPKGPCAVDVGHGPLFFRKIASLSYTNRPTRRTEASQTQWSNARHTTLLVIARASAPAGLNRGRLTAMSAQVAGVIREGSWTRSGAGCCRRSFPSPTRAPNVSYVCGRVVEMKQQEIAENRTERKDWNWSVEAEKSEDHGWFKTKPPRPWRYRTYPSTPTSTHTIIHLVSHSCAASRAIDPLQDTSTRTPQSPVQSFGPTPFQCNRPRASCPALLLTPQFWPSWGLNSTLLTPIMRWVAGTLDPATRQSGRRSKHGTSYFHMTNCSSRRWAAHGHIMSSHILSYPLSALSYPHIRWY
jgi:hypothetical protein